MHDNTAEQARIANVHPPAWENPRAKDKYHIVVVGGGTGGLVTAAIAAGLGARTALVERHWMGGDCLNVGCVPSKALLRSARAWHEAETAHQRFGGPAIDGQRDFAAAVRRMQKIRADISAVDSAHRYRDLGVDVYFGQASFTGADSITVDGQTLRFRRAVIATGTRPAIPAIPGLADSGYLTNETIFSLTEVPRRLVVIGGGPIGAELAQAFARFGSAVTVLQRGERILDKDDPEAAGIVAAALARDGVRILTGATIRRVERRESIVVHLVCGGRSEELEADAILVASGRVPNVEELGLDAAGVEYDDRQVVTDDRLRTSNRRVFAVGDITGRAPFTHVADAHARMVVQNALFFGRKKVSSLVIPWCTYTQPELAHVGMKWDAANEAGGKIESITIPLHDVDRARLDGDDEGFLRVHFREGSDRIVAATLVASHAGEIIGQLSMAMQQGLGLSAIGATVFPYPTQAEVIRKSADAWRKRKLSPRVRGLFRSYFRIIR
ncbi:MAG: mercuric reductase [Gemmatimonadaceae bacterium]|nr:mercuric reductase [Gemmatimonadaceae bacterium]